MNGMARRLNGYLSGRSGGNRPKVLGKKGDFETTGKSIFDFKGVSPLSLTRDRH